MGVITLADYWMGRDEKYASELTGEIRANAAKTVEKANALLSEFVKAGGSERAVTSGWRPSAVSASISNAAPKSKHMTGQAIDLADPEGDFDEWCFANLSVLQELGLWLEHPASTKGWTHVQVVPPRSGNRVFYP